MCSYLCKLEGIYRNYRYLRSHRLQKRHALGRRRHLLSLRDIVRLGSFLSVLKAFWAGQPETWLPAPSVSLPILLSITRLRFPKGIDPGLLDWAIRTRVGSWLLPLLVTPTLLLFKVTSLLSSRCPCSRCTPLGQFQARWPTW
jgi:hypothetical protein